MKLLLQVTWIIS